MPLHPQHALHDWWVHAHSHAPVLPAWQSMLLAVATFGLIIPNRPWRVTRNVITIIHEAGHALVAVLVGRRLNGIKLHSDTSGVTVTTGRPTGPGMVATSAAGYLAPSATGAGLFAALRHGYAPLVLTVATAALLVMLCTVRNAYGALILCTSVIALAMVTIWTGPRMQSATASTLTWFLLLAAPRPVFELRAKRRRHDAAGSDVEQLAALTGIPAALWQAAFIGATLLAAAACLWSALRG